MEQLGTLLGLAIWSGLLLACCVVGLFAYQGLMVTWEWLQVKRDRNRLNR
jgi:hypothetical protein